MSIFLSRTPGYFVNPPRMPGEPDRAQAIRLLSRHAGSAAVEAMVERGTLVLVRGIENFPRSVRAGALLSCPRPACVFVPEEGRVYADIACPRPEALEPEFLICAGVLAEGRIAFVERLLAKAARILDETAQKEKPGTRANLAGIRHAFNSHVWRREMRGVALLHQLALEVDAIVDEKLTAEVVELLRTHKFSYTGRRLVALLPLLVRDAAARSREELIRYGVGLYDEAALEEAELPLSAVCSVTRQAPPPAEEFFGKGTDEAVCRAACTERYPYPELPEQLLLEDWVPVIGSILEASGAPESPLASRSIRPCARFELMTGRGADKAPSIGMAATLEEDPLENERTALHVLPFARTAARTAVEVLGAEVGESLDWAVLTLKAKDLHAGLIRAYCTSWVRQSEKLRTRRFYDVHLALWACSARRVEEGRHSLAKAEGWSEARPKVTLCGLVERIEDAGELCGRRYSRLRLTQEKRRGGVFEAILAKDELERAGLKAGCRAELSGYFLAGDFTGHLAARAASRLARRADVLKALSSDLRKLVKKFKVDPLNPKSLFSFLDPLIENGFPEAAEELIAVSQLCGGSRMANYTLAFLSYVDAKAAGTVKAYAACAESFAAALKEGFDAVLNQPMVLCRELFERFPADIRSWWIAALPLVYADPTLIIENVSAREAKLDQLSPGDREIAGRLSTNMLLHSLNTNRWDAAYELARRYALGLGAEKDLERARLVLEMAARHGDIASIFGVRAITRMDERLFTLEKKGVLAECADGIVEGNPASILLTALFFVKNASDDPKSYLRMAYALLKTLDGRLEPRLVASFIKGIREELHICTEEDEKELEAFDPWKLLGIPKPDPRYPLYRLAAVNESVRDLNRVFLHELDSGYRGEMTARIRSQLEFLEPAATPTVNDVLPGGFDADSSPLKQTEVSGTAPAGGVPARLTFVYERESKDDPWTLAEAYPIFDEGIELVFSIRNATGNEAATTMVLACSYEGPKTGAVTLFVHDALWPSRCGAYLVGDRMRFSVYGVGESLTILPEGSLKASGLHEAGAIRRLVEAEPPRALFVTESPVLGLRRCAAQVAGVDYSILEIMPFFDAGARHFPVYVPDSMIPDGLHPGMSVRAAVRLTGYALGLEKPQGGGNA